MKKQLLLQLITVLISSQICLSQKWMDLWQKEENFYTIQKAFNEYWKDKEVVKGHSYKQFKRWEYFTEPRVYPSGDLSLLSTNLNNYQEFLNANSTDLMINNSNQIASTTWQAMGPFGPLSGLAENALPRKAGRINFVTFHPTNPNTYWVGAPAGGLWKTTNNGATWTTNTDNLSVIGCSDLAVDPTNTNIMYLATGDGYWYSTYSIGVLKTTDGGLTWNPTGLVFPVSSKIQMRRLIIDPSNTQVVIAATSNGIYRTQNGGTNWTQVNNLNTFDLEFNAANTTTVYAAGLSFSVSVNNGVSFTLVNNGIPSNQGRMAIATTTADPNYVYVVASTAASLFQGFYRSINAGTSFSLMANSPNILSSNCTTPIADGQGVYDLSIAASPLNKNEVVVGGIGVWQSLNGGNSWVNIGCAYGTGNPPFLHADHHDLEYTPTGVLYGANDGGIYNYTGTQWPDLTAPMNIAQIYKLGLSSLSPNLWITGHQDNGSNIYNNGTYSASLSGDGMDCFVDRLNDQYLYASRYNGQLYYSGNGGLAWATCTTGASTQGAWVTPWKQDPQSPTTYYCGKSQMKKSTVWPPVWLAPQGTMNGVNAAQYIAEFAIAPSNNQRIYAIHGTTGMFVSNDAGATWTVSNTGIPVASGALTFVTVHPTNPLMAWVTMSGYSGGNKVFKTINGGTSWTNISYNLPNLPANCSVFEMNSTIDRVYVGMDVGVYYIDNTNSTTWTLYNTGLPNTPITDLEISPASPTKIRAATFGRGVYQVDVVPSPVPPVTAFNFAGNTCSVTATFLCNDISTNAPNAWSWSVTPAAGVVINTPTSQNPTITIANQGTYSISLLASNGFGAGTVYTKTLTVAVAAVTVSASTLTPCTGSAVTLSGAGANTYTWQPGGFTGSNVTYTPAISQVYTVTGTASNGCTDVKTVSITVINCGLGINSVGETPFKFNVFPNPTKEKLNVNIDVNKETDFELKITDAMGKLVLFQTARFSALKNEQQINIEKLSDGIYFLKVVSKEGDSGTIKIIKE